MGNLDGLIPTFVGLGIVIALSIWGCWELIDWFWFDDAIRSTTLIEPEIELVIEDGKLDTIYVYRKP